jgi:hypothetical protein
MQSQSNSSHVIYDLKQDHLLLRQIREASLSSGNLGLAIGDSGIVGSAEWWEAVEAGKLPIMKFVGAIRSVDGGPMGDSRILRIDGERETKSWTAWEGFDPTLTGKRIEVQFVRLPPKCPPRPGFMVDLILQVTVLEVP